MLVAGRGVAQLLSLCGIGVIWELGQRARDCGRGKVRFQRCCYIMIDSVTTASQNGASFYCMFLNRAPG